jgi:hypothetical protein
MKGEKFRIEDCGLHPQNRKGLPSEQEALKCLLLNEGVGRAVPAAEAATATLRVADCGSRFRKKPQPRFSLPAPHSPLTAFYLLAEFQTRRAIQQGGDHLGGGNMIVDHTVDGFTDRHIHAQAQR